MTLANPPESAYIAGGHLQALFGLPGTADRPLACNRGATLNQV
jgi:hypothetical protein